MAYYNLGHCSTPYHFHKAIKISLLIKIKILKNKKKTIGLEIHFLLSNELIFLFYKARENLMDWSM